MSKIQPVVTKVEKNPPSVRGKRATYSPYKEKNGNGTKNTRKERHLKNKENSKKDVSLSGRMHTVSKNEERCTEVYISVHAKPPLGPQSISAGQT